MFIISSSIDVIIILPSAIISHVKLFSFLSNSAYSLLWQAEVRALQQNTQRFNKQTAQWLQTVETFNTALKELGDVELWVRNIEAEMAAITTKLAADVEKP